MGGGGMTNEDMRWLADHFSVVNGKLSEVSEEVLTLKIHFEQYCEKHGEEMVHHMSKCHVPFSKSFKKIVASLGAILAVVVALKELGWLPF